MADEVAIDLSGAANAEVHAKKKLVADVSGAANVAYWGSPDKVSRSVTGVGNVAAKQ